MPQKRKGAKLNIAPPHIKSLYQVRKLNFEELEFKPLTIMPGEDLKVKYHFMASAKNNSGIFVIKEKESNKILFMGCSTKDLYGQVSICLRRYKIDLQTVVLTTLKVPGRLLDAVMVQIRRTHQLQLVDDTYKKVLPLFLSGQDVPINEINFFPMYDLCPKSPVHTVRVKTNVAYLRYRPGIYIIMISKKNKEKWLLDYIGKTRDLNKRINGHFLKSQKHHQPHANYWSRRKTHDFKIGVIEFPKSEVSQYLSMLEDKMIKQFDPPANRRGKVISGEITVPTNLHPKIRSGWREVTGAPAF